MEETADSVAVVVQEEEEEEEEVEDSLQTAFTKFDIPAKRRKKKVYGSSASTDLQQEEDKDHPTNQLDKELMTVDDLEEINRNEEPIGLFPSNEKSDRANNDDDDDNITVVSDADDATDDATTNSKLTKDSTPQKTSTTTNDSREKTTPETSSTGEETDAESIATKGDEHTTEVVSESDSDHEPSGRSKRGKAKPTKRLIQTEDDDNNDDTADETQDEADSLATGSPPPTQETVQETETTTRRSTRARSKPQRFGTASPEEDDRLVAWVDDLYRDADLDTATIGSIMKSLESKHGIRLDRSNKRRVRTRLGELINGTAKLPPKPQTPPDDNTPTDNDNDTNAEPSTPDGTKDDGDPPQDDDEDAAPDSDEELSAKEEPVATAKKPRRRQGSSRLKASASKTLARRVRAEMLRKKRMEELRVRNEELQLKQNEADQERAASIAAKFETNTDQQRLKRWEDRVGLLQKLDRKRIDVVSAETGTTAQESDSDDDSVLELVEAPRPGPKPARSSVLDLLRQRGRPTPACAVRPAKALSAREALRSTLLSKQRKIGNMWLARELGYKTEEDHLRDCREAEKQKRELVLQRETARLQENQQRLARDHKYLEEEEEADNDVEQETAQEEEEKHEEDEELALAKEIESEQKQDPTQSEADKPVHAQETETDAPMDGMESARVADSEQAELSPNDPSKPKGKVVSANHTDDDSMDAPSLVVALEAAEAPRESASGDTGEIVQTNDKGTEIGKALDTAPASSPMDSACKPEDSQGDIQSTTAEKSQETNDGSPLAADDEDEEEEEAEFDDSKEPAAPPAPKSNKPKNSLWQAMLQKEAERVKKMRRRKGGDLVETEADEEEEEDAILGLGDFGFSVAKKKTDDDDDDGGNDELADEDLAHVVDDLSDNEGDEEAGERARKTLEKQREKERHKEIMRRMREGYDGRRGGIAGGGVGARGMHRFDQLVAADNREDAKRLGLLNDDELDSEAEEDDGDGKDDEIEDETALLDKMLKDRFLHRSSVELEENFSEDEEDEQQDEGLGKFTTFLLVAEKSECPQSPSPFCSYCP